MSSVDTEHRRLCHALFDAIEQGDVDGVERVLRARHDDVVQRHRRDDRAARRTWRRSPRARPAPPAPYNDRIINTFDDGFVVQYTMNIVAHDGSEIALSACLVAEVRDGKITSCSSTSTRASSRSAGLMHDRGRDPRAVQPFFDAYEDRRVDELDQLYADDCIIWHNVFGRETTRDENLARCPTATRASAGAPTTTASSTPSTTAS